MEELKKIINTKNNERPNLEAHNNVVRYLWDKGYRDLTLISFRSGAKYYKPY